MYELSSLPTITDIVINFSISGCFVEIKGQFAADYSING
jgi:hypothetical protein